MRGSTPPAALHALNAANADAQLDDLLHHYFRLATPPPSSAPGASASARRRLKRPLSASTTTPETATVTPESALRRLKSFLKGSSDSDKHIQRVLDALAAQLHKAKRQRALLPLALRLATEMFARSAAFRARVAARAAAFYTQLLEAAGEKDVAKLQRRPRGQPQSSDVCAVLAMIESWREKFGAKYPTIVAGHAGLVDMGYEFPRVREASANAVREAEERLRHQASVRQLQMRKMEREMATHVPEMETTIVEMDNIFEILVPTLEAFELDKKKDDQESVHPPQSMANEADGAGDDDDEDAVEWEDVDTPNATEQASGAAEETPLPGDHRDDGESDIEWEDVDHRANGSEDVDSVEHDDDFDEFAADDDMDINDIVRAYGLGSSSYQLTISIPTTLCEKSAENEVLFRSLADGVLQIRKRFLPLLGSWLQIAGDDAVALDLPRDVALLRQLQDLRRRLEGVTLKWEDLVKESERKQFARIRPRVVTLPLATIDRGHQHHSDGSSRGRSGPQRRTVRQKLL